MVKGREVYENFVKCLPGDPIVGKLMREGGTIYRKSDEGVLLIVPNGRSHNEVWNIATGRSL